jgi:hypothetical protein
MVSTSVQDLTNLIATTQSTKQHNVDSFRSIGDVALLWLIRSPMYLLIKTLSRDKYPEAALVIQQP